MRGKTALSRVFQPLSHSSSWEQDLILGSSSRAALCARAAPRCWGALGTVLSRALELTLRPAGGVQVFCKDLGALGGVGGLSERRDPQARLIRAGTHMGEGGMLEAGMGFADSAVRGRGAGPGTWCETWDVVPPALRS